MYSSESNLKHATRPKFAVVTVVDAVDDMVVDTEVVAVDVTDVVCVID
jgi:hypothetical protein